MYLCPKQPPGPPPCLPHKRILMNSFGRGARSLREIHRSHFTERSISRVNVSSSLSAPLTRFAEIPLCRENMSVIASSSFGSPHPLLPKSDILFVILTLEAPCSLRPRERCACRGPSPVCHPPSTFNLPRHTTKSIHPSIGNASFCLFGHRDRDGMKRGNFSNFQNGFQNFSFRVFE